jgi:hypothetical protein
MTSQHGGAAMTSCPEVREDTTTTAAAAIKELTSEFKGRDHRDSYRENSQEHDTHGAQERNHPEHGSRRIATPPQERDKPFTAFTIDKILGNSEEKQDNSEHSN